jgi:putative peptidoglycan lipid II flippase
VTVRRLARAAAIVAIFGLVSRLLGFAREIILAASFGASAATDAFVSSMLIVNSVAAVLLYTMVTLVIPTFQQEREAYGRRSAWQLVYAFSAWVGVVLIALTALVAIFPEAPAWLFQLDTERADLTERLIRIMAPALMLQGLSALFTALLQIHGRFAGPAAVGVVFNLGIITGTLIGASGAGIEAAAWGVTAGAIAQILLQTPQFVGLVRESRTRPVLTHPRLGHVTVLAMPVLGASVLQQVNNFTDKLFASSLEAGRVTALQFANTLGQAPRAALLLPLLTPLFPTIARLVAEGREGDALTAFRRAVGLLGFLAVPITVFMAIYAQEISQLAFGRGECDAGCVDETASPLFFYAFAIWSGFASMLMNRTLSAAHRQRAIMAATAITVALTIGLDILLLGPLEQAGLALASAIAVWVNALMLLGVMQRRFPELEVRALGAQAARLVLAGVVAAGVAFAIDFAVPTDDVTSPWLWLLMAFKAGVVIGAYLIAARFLAPAELREGHTSVRAVISRRRG